MSFLLCYSPPHLTARPPPGLPPGSERPSAAAAARSLTSGHDETAGSSHTSHRNHTLVTDRDTEQSTEQTVERDRLSEHGKDTNYVSYQNKNQTKRVSQSDAKTKLSFFSWGKTGIVMKQQTVDQQNRTLNPTDPLHNLTPLILRLVSFLLCFSPQRRHVPAFHNPISHFQFGLLTIISLISVSRSSCRNLDEMRFEVIKLCVLEEYFPRVSQKQVFYAAKTIIKHINLHKKHCYKLFCTD